MKIAKNLRHSLNCGNSALRASDSPQFLTLIPRFSSRNFHKAGFLLSRKSHKKKVKYYSSRISDIASVWDRLRDQTIPLSMQPRCGDEARAT
jgi:hypothetical protein